MDQSQMSQLKMTCAAWMRKFKIKCGWNKKEKEPMFNGLRSDTKYTKKEFFNQLTLYPIFHRYRASVDHCTCAIAQHYQGLPPSVIYEQKYIKRYKVALLERRKH